ncbi:hypothetical protein [Microterricola viridarii]|uniref:Uncharacterized protein n=1 Tax=Microterricola viridarii TaxID=412690 RepID=A0A1H1VG01_9MICO|nr:hypothetical protein [Microterricola viridarii]SDS83663.1 hypothetical protein SAMN04489834_2255 [Microterricola viridarii]
MNDHEVEEALLTEHLDAAANAEGTHPVQAERSLPSAAPRRSQALRHPGRSTLVRPDYRSGIVWVRASDLLNTGTGRIAGRGLDFESELVRRMRRAPATTRRAIRERTDRLPPLSAFGRSTESASVAQHGLGRREL